MQPDLSGKKLDSYHLVRLLGKGGMASVYESYQGQRRVAIKIVSQNLAEQPGYIERFNREVRLAAALEHLHITPVYDFGAVAGFPYIVMRYLTGGDLQQRLSKLGRPSLAETQHLLTQISSGLDYAHRQQVVHRDLKPANVMFDGDGNAYLADFGIAKPMTELGLTGTGMAMGTPLYMSPEQWQGQSIDERTDIYALALIGTP